MRDGGGDGGRAYSAEQYQLNPARDGAIDALKRLCESGSMRFGDDGPERFCGAQYATLRGTGVAPRARVGDVHDAAWAAFVTLLLVCLARTRYRDEEALTLL